MAFETMTFMIRKIGWFLCGTLLAFAVQAQVSSHRIEKSFLLNAPETMTVDQLAQQTFVPYQYDLHLGFQDQPVWLRFDIQPIPNLDQSGSAERLSDSQKILRLSPFQLDTVEVYERHEGQWRVQTIGDRELMSQRICPDDSHCIALLGSPRETETLYLKVKQRGVLSVRAEVLPFKALSQAVAIGSSRNSASVAIAGSLLFMALVLFVIERNMLLFTFCCFQAVVVIFILCTTGRLQYVMPDMAPTFFDNLTHHLFSLRVLMFILLGWASLAQYKPNARYQQMVLVLLLLLLVSNILIQMDKVQWAISLYLSVTSLNLLVQSYGILSAANMPARIRVLLIFAYIVYLLVLVGALLVIFGQLMPLATSSFVNSYADWRTNGGPAGIIIFLIVIIQQAERKVATSQVIGKLSLEAAKSQANHEKLTERQTLIDMLTHELKNPLGTIRFALASLKKQSPADQEALTRVSRMDRSVERMNELIEHVAHSNKIDRFELTSEKETFDADELIDELTADQQSERRFNIDIEDGATFHTHRHMLFVVLENLISNACKYENHRLPIRIAVTSQAQATVVEIANSIDPSIRPDEGKLFDRYYRHDGVQSMPGMGIGLSLVNSAAQKMGAQVRYQKIDQDVVFEVRFPR
jgi:signal transduction histidine kinase